MLMTPPTPLRPALDRGVGVHAPGRLHLGFLDPSGSLGRRFGSLGLVIDGFETALELRATARQQVEVAVPDVAGDADRAASYLATLQRATGCDTPLQLRLLSLLPAHAGFGSGTQLALAVGRAFAQLHGLDLTTRQIAQLLGRGLRSGVGIAGFDQGGLLLDGGPSEDGSPAPLLSRVELPADWRVLLILDPSRQGLSGGDEKSAIAALPRFAQADAAAICHEVLMRVLPGAATGDFAAFAAGVSRVQQLVGSHFAPAQDGRIYASPAVERVCEWIARQAEAGVGQSSWGPTGFAILPSADAAEALAARARAAGIVDAALRLQVAAPRATGALVTSRPAR